MKKMLVLACLMFSSVSMAETWYGFCIATKDDVRYCTIPEIKSTATELRCREFARDLGANTSAMRFSTSLEGLEASMGEHCDEVRGTTPGSIYACQYATLCPSGTEALHHLASKVYADTKAKAIDRCLAANESKLKLELRKQSALDCFTRVVVEVME